MADISIFNPEVKKSRDGFSMPAAGESLFQKRIEFHLAKKPLSPYTSNGGDFHLETLNPSSSDVQRSGLCLGGPSVGAGKRSDHAVDLFEHGLDTELSFGITFRRIGAGLANLGNTCFLNSVLQCLTYTEPFAAYLQSGKHQSSCRTAGFCALCAIQNHVRDALQSTGKILSPKHLVKNLRCISRNFQNAKQEDAHEYMVNLLESMHKCCLPSGVLSESPGAYEKSLVHRIFGGRLRSQVKCTQCSFCSNKFDPFLDLSLEIVKADSLSKALAHFTAVEQLDGGERQYQCQRCKEKVKALKQLTIHKPPNVLTIHLKRFGSHVPGQKINKKVNFGPTLDLKPFASDPHEGDLKYTLYGVLVHAGWSTHSGHYYCFVRTSTGMWYSLDDNQVVQVSERAVLEQKAYMLFYIRDRRRSTPRKPLDIVRKDNMVVNTSGKKEIPVSVLLCSKQTIQNGGKEGRLISSKCSSIARTDTFTSQDKSVPAVGTSSKDPISKEVSAVQAGDLGMAEGLRQSTTSEDPRLDRSSRNSKAKEPSLRDPSVLRNATEDSLTENSYKTAFRLHDTTVATEVSMISPGNLQCSPSCNSNGSSINSVVLIASQNHNKEFQKFSVTVPVAGNGMLEKVDTGSVKASINSPRTSVHDPEAENIEVKKLSNRSSVANGVLVKNYSQCGDLLNDRRSADTLCQPTRENDKKPNETISVKLSSQFGSVSSSLQNEALDATPAKLKPKKHLRFPTVMSIHRGSKHLFLASLNLRKRKKHKRGKWRRNQDMRKLTQKALMGEFVSSDQGPSTSGKARAVDHDRNHGQDQRSHSVSNNGKNNEVAKDMTDHDSGSLHRKERSLSERSGPNSIMLATNELSEKSSSSMAKQCDVRETNGQGKSVSAQHGLMRMLTRGLEEVTVARWDGIELPDAECHGLIDNRKSSIGYVLDERDEEYDRGKRKKVRKSTQPFGGPNPFQEFATETAQVKKMKMMGWNNSGRNPFRI